VFKVGEQSSRWGFQGRKICEKNLPASHHAFRGAKNPHSQLRRASFTYVAGRLVAENRTHDQSLGCRGGRCCWWKMRAANFTRCPRQTEKLRMCADNGLLRRKLQIGSLLK